MSSEGTSQGLVRSNYEMVKNRLGGKTLLHAGFAYNFHRNNKHDSVWTCVNKRHGRCGGLVKLTNESDNVQMQKGHKPECKPDLLKNEIKVVMNDLKQEVTTNFSPIQKMFEVKTARLQNKGHSEKIPIYNNVKKAIYRSRNTSLNVKKTRFTDPAEVVIPEIFRKHMLVDYNEDGNRIIIFVSEKALEDIKNVHHFFCDGTFDCCPCPFKQIYTIHGDIGDNTDDTNIVPIFYALLVTKERKTYEIMFRKIKEALIEFKPLKFTLDFEISAMVAITNEFPNAEIHGCFVHFQNAIYRRAKSLRLLDHEETTQYVKLCICLAYLPEEDIEDGWLSIMENSIPDEQITKFNDYFVEQWLEPTEKIAKWCCYKEKHRTTNLVEAWNHRLTRHLGKNPSLLSFLEMITIDISTYGTAQARLKAKNIPVSRRKNASRKNAKMIANLTEQYKNKKITTIMFLEQICPYVEIRAKK